MSTYIKKCILSEHTSIIATNTNNNKINKFIFKSYAYELCLMLFNIKTQGIENKNFTTNC